VGNVPDKLVFDFQRTAERNFSHYYPFHCSGSREVEWVSSSKIDGDHLYLSYKEHAKMVHITWCYLKDTVSIFYETLILLLFNFLKAENSRFDLIKFNIKWAHSSGLMVSVFSSMSYSLKQ